MLITAAESRRKTPTVMYSAGSVSTPITAGGASMESQSPQNKMARVLGLIRHPQGFPGYGDMYLLIMGTGMEPQLEITII